MHPFSLAMLRRVLYGVVGAFLLLSSASAKIMDGGVDPANLGKGEQIYVLSQAINGMNGNVPSINSLSTMMTYLKGKGIEYIIVKAGTGADDYYYPSGNLQFTASLVNAGHAAGIKVMGYTRSDGIDVQGEIDLAARVYNLGADGFIIDAEIEWESRNLTNNFNKALQLASGIKALFPNKFLAHAPFPYISLHSTFPYKEFGLYCDAVMPQDYWNEISAVNCSPTQMVADMSKEWRNWQSGLTGNWTNSIKPICPIGSAWNSTCTVSGADIIEFVNALKADSNPATTGGYHGVNYWRAELQTADMWSGVGSGDIGTKPKVLVQPKSVTVTNVTSTNVTMTVGAVGGNPLSYQWLFNGVNIAGATNWTYTISNVQFTNGGGYSVFITNSLGSTNSTSATLTVKSPPQITTQPLGQTVIVSNSATFNVTAIGTATLKYQWRFNGTNIVGATSSSYTRSNAALTNAGNYNVVITNAFGAITSSVANLVVVSSAAAPVITLQPQGRIVLAGSTATLSVAAAGTSPFSFQWRLNGTNLATGTSSVLTMTNIQPASAGNYSVIVSNNAGVDTSLDALLSVHYSLTLSIAGDGTVTRTPSAATYAPNTVVTLTPGKFFSGWSGNASGTTNPLSVTMNGHKTITATFSDMDLIIESRTSNGGVPPSTNYTDSSTFANSSLKSSAAGLSGSTNQGSRYAGTGTPSFTATPTLPTAGGTYRVEVTHGSASSISADIIVTNKVTGGSLSASSTTAFQRTQSANLWTSVGLLTLNAGVTNPSVKFGYASGTLNATDGRFYSDAVQFVYLPLPFVTAQPSSQTNVAGANANFTVEAARATGYQWRFNGTNIATATTSSYTRNSLQANDAGSYSVLVSGTNGSVTSSNAILTVLTVPSISTGPQTQTVNQGENATFTVSSSGSSPLSYQWRFLGLNIAGATNSAYFRNGVQPNDAGAYSVLVRNSAGSAVSSDAMLTIRTPPEIVTGPADQTVNPGSPVSFSVTASGAGPLSYQWDFNGTAISGATNTIYSLANPQQTNEGFYSVSVSNAAGATLSDSALLTVNEPPDISVQPESQSLETGETANFSVSASGMEPLFYQWFFNNSPIASATSSSFSKSNVQTNDSGNYKVTVSNTVGVATSDVASLVVAPPTKFEAPVVFTNNTIQLLFTTKPGATNILERSLDLGGWVPVSTNVSTNGVGQFIDNETNAGPRFYRALRVP